MAATVETNPALLPFKKAIEFLRKKVIIAAPDWNALTSEANNYAFFISGVTDLKLLSDTYDLLLKLQERGDTFADFKKAFNKFAIDAGWQPKEGLAYRAKLIWSQNLRTNYQAGKHQQMTTPDMLKRRPYGEWVHRDSRNPRPAHKALDGKVFNMEDLIALNLLCPNGFGCRCTIITHRQVPEGKTLQAKPNKTITLTNSKTGKSAKYPALTVNGKLEPIVEAGFDYNPGITNPKKQKEVVNDLLAGLPPTFRPGWLTAVAAKLIP